MNDDHRCSVGYGGKWQKIHGFNQKPHWFIHSTGKTVHHEPKAPVLVKVFKSRHEALEDDDDETIVAESGGEEYNIRLKDDNGHIFSPNTKHKSSSGSRIDEAEKLLRSDKHFYNIGPREGFPEERLSSSSSRAKYQAILHFGGIAIPEGVGASYHIFDIASGHTMCYGTVSVEVSRLDTFPFANAASHYIGLIQGINAAVTHNIDSLLIRGSSQVVINQMKTNCDLNQKLLGYLYQVASNVGGRQNGLFQYMAFDYLDEKDNLLAMKLSKKAVFNPESATDSVEFDSFHPTYPYYRFKRNPSNALIEIDID
jgi:hypothetical protein